MPLHSIVTVVGKNKEAAKKAANEPIVLTEIALGSSARYPSGGETALETEVHRGAISGSGVEANAPNVTWFDLYVDSTVGTFQAQEIGLFDEDGLLYAISRFDAPVPKFGPDASSASDNTFRIRVVIADTENVVVEVDAIHGVSGDRRVDTDETSGLFGGGDLSEDRTHSIAHAAVDQRGAIKIAASPLDIAETDTTVTPSQLLPLLPAGANKSRAFTPQIRLADIANINTPTQIEAVLVSGTTYITVFGACAFQNTSSTLCTMTVIVQLYDETTATVIGSTDYLGCQNRDSFQDGLPTYGQFNGLDPTHTYRVQLIVEKGVAAGPVRVLDSTLTVFHA